MNDDQMTLAYVMRRLAKEEDRDRVVAEGFGAANSYRWDHEQIAFEPAANVTIGSMLNHVYAAIGKLFEGYKGGNYTMPMNMNTPVNIAAYGQYSDDDELTFARLERMLAQPEACDDDNRHTPGEPGPLEAVMAHKRRELRYRAALADAANALRSIRPADRTEQIRAAIDAAERAIKELPL